MGIFYHNLICAVKKSDAHFQKMLQEHEGTCFHGVFSHFDILSPVL